MISVGYWIDETNVDAEIETNVDAEIQAKNAEDWIDETNVDAEIQAKNAEDWETVDGAR